MDLALLGLVLIFALRLLVPLTILRWPLWGALASALVDALDTNIVKPFGAEIPNYVYTDKYLDMYYLSFELFVSLRWNSRIAKSASIFLYFWRLVGIVSLEVTGIRYLLFIFPNLFEHFFIFFEILRKIGKDAWLNSYSKLSFVLLLLWITKVPQELVLHVYKVGTPVESFFSWVRSIFQ